MDNKFQMVAKTFKGLEEVLAGELIALGAENVEIGQRMVAFEGDLRLLYSANLCCRTALRILKPLYKFEASDPDELYDAVRDIEWEDIMNVDSTFVVDSTVNSQDFTHSKFVTYRVKDGIVDHFSDRYNKRPSIRLSNADVMLNVHIFENRVTISLDSSGEPLSKRGYRVEQTDAPINEVLAAGILMLSGWRGETPLADPMCGSGTFLVEAALIAANINPGIYRKSFAFEKWADFDRDLFAEVYEDDSNERPFAHKIYGGDIDGEAVAIARKNIRSAGVENMVELTCKPMQDWTENAPEGVLVMNPPYGERLRPGNIELLYKEIGSTLKNHFKGWHAWIIGTSDDLFAQIGLKPSVKIDLLNGSLECSLREYMMFDGRYNDFRAAGGKVSRDEESLPEGATRTRHVSNSEWRKEAKSFNRGKQRREFRKDGERDYRKDNRRKDDRRKNDRRDFRKTDRNHETRDFREARKIIDKGPRISADNEVVFSKIHMRQRKGKGWKKNSDEADD